MYFCGGISVWYTYLPVGWWNVRYVCGFHGPPCCPVESWVGRLSVRFVGRLLCFQSLCVVYFGGL